jgi:uncharacterized protein YjbJ (UPF0337 family)
MANDDQVKGTAKKVKGDIKEGVGKATGDKEMENKGRADQVEGEAQKTKGNVKDKI